MIRLTKVIILGVLFIVLTACGVDNESEPQQDAANDSEQQAEKDTSAENSSEEDNQNKNKDENKNSTTSPSPEDTITYQFNGEEKQETAILKDSNNQAFSIYVLPSYDLRATEPYNDEIYYQDNDRYFMRINILPQDTDLDSLMENTKAQLQALNEKVDTVEPPQDDDFFQHAKILETSSNGEVVTAYIIEQPEAYIKLLLFTTDEADHRDAMIQMAKTIKTGNASNE